MWLKVVPGYFSDVQIENLSFQEAQSSRAFGTSSSRSFYIQLGNLRREGYRDSDFFIMKII